MVVQNNSSKYYWIGRVFDLIYYSPINYPDLVDWLKQCIGNCQNPKVINFLNEFQNYILREFAGIKDMSEQDAVVKILEKYDGLEAALVIAQAKDVMQSRMLQDFNDQLKAAVAVRNSKENWSIDGKFDNNAQSGVDIYFKRIQTKLRFRVGFFGSNYQKLTIGIAKLNKEILKDEKIWTEIYEIVKKSLPDEVVYKSDWWPFYIQLEDVENGRTEMELWQQIQSGTLCKRIMDYAEKTCEALKEEKLLDQL